MNCEIISVGTEILLGEIANTDAQMISQTLSEHGVNVFFHTVCGDNPQRLSECVSVARKRAELIITTGGLGPTCDDLTKETLCKAFGKKLIEFEDETRKLREKMGDRMTPNNLKQAYLPEGCTVLQNDWGTAPACAFEADGCTVIMLPGPPRECTPVFRLRAVPYLENKFGGVISSDFIKIFGMGESQMEDKLSFLMDAANPSVAPYAKDGECEVRVTARAETAEKAKALCAPIVEQIKGILGDVIYGVNVSSLEEVVVRGLCEKGLTIAAAESCTGGLLLKRLTDIPGSSGCVSGGFVTYSNEMKENLLGVSHDTLLKHGAVSEETAFEMARGVCKVTGADIGVAITGIAGPGGGTPEKPVGTIFCAVCYKGEIKVLPCNRFRKWSDRAYNRNYAASFALDMVRRAALSE
ncbi:MAG: competence/damage-inducible protein A [Clostridia bacterium]|nr:competence/damage-inducible protein A [Clostridia bacterium]